MDSTEEYRPNLNYNSIRYTPEEWAVIQHTFKSRIWGLRVTHVAQQAGRTRRRTAIGRWSYRHDLDSLLLAALGVVLFFGVMVLSIAAVLL